MLISVEILKNLLIEAKSQNKKIVFTNGCFDIIHSGHVYYLNEAKKMGDILVIGLNSDDSVRRLKGNSRPINSQNDRAVVLSALKSVDYVVYFEDDTPLNLISSLLPDILVKGGDYQIDDIVGADVVRNNGGSIITISFVEGKSTTNIINKMKN